MSGEVRNLLVLRGKPPPPPPPGPAAARVEEVPERGVTGDTTRAVAQLLRGSSRSLLSLSLATPPGSPLQTRLSLTGPVGSSVAVEVDDQDDDEAGDGLRSLGHRRLASVAARRASVQGELPMSPPLGRAAAAAMAESRVLPAVRTSSSSHSPRLAPHSATPRVRGLQSEEPPAEGRARSSSYVRPAERFDPPPVHDDDRRRVHADGRLEAGSFAGVVQHLLEHGQADMLDEFVLQYRMFAAPTTLLSLLSAQARTRPEAVELLLKVWIQRYLQRDFFFHGRANRAFRRLRRLLRDDFSVSAANRLKLAVLRAHSGARSPHAPLSSSSMPTALESQPSWTDLGGMLSGAASAALAGGGGGPEVRRGELGMRELAETLTSIEAAMFSAIGEREFLDQQWKQADPPRSGRRVVAMVRRFNRMGFWIAYRIVRVRELEERAQLVERFIALAQHCYELNNFNTLMEVLGGLNHHSVRRLKATWAALAEPALATLAALEALMAHTKNYALYRERLRAVEDQPCLPYIGIYLRDLTFVEEGNPTYTADGLINYEKIRLTGAIVLEIQRFQRLRYDSLPPLVDSPATRFLSHLKAYSEDALESLSFDCEPKRSPSQPSILLFDSESGDPSTTGDPTTGDSSDLHSSV